MTTQIALPHGAAGPGRVGQGTAIEQSRAAAEVYYRVLVAKEMPRDEQTAHSAMKRACDNLRLAARAFYSVPRGSERATGGSIHLARELARIWGNIDYGVHELLRDDDHGQSEILAFAWDLQTNARSGAIFIQPHKLDTRRGVKHLTEVQAIYESNANAGARRVREAIFAVLPDYFVEEAQELCRATLERGDGTPLDERRRKAIDAFATEFGVTERQLVDRLHRAVERWDAEDVASLQILYRSLKNREVQVDVEFPPEANAVTVGELNVQQPAAETPAPDAPPADAPPAADAATPAPETPAEAPPAGDAAPAPSQPEPAPSDPPPPRSAPATLLKRIGVLASDAKLDSEGRLAFVSAVVGRTVETTKALSNREAASVVVQFEKLQTETDDFPGAVENYLRVDEQRRMEAELADGEQQS